MMKIARCLIVYKMKILDKDELKRHIRQLLHLEKDIDIISDDTVTHLKVMGKDFYIYIKTVTYAGNPYPRNTTRAQLPSREEFNDIKNSDAVFLFLGYDVDNEVFVCWDPVKTKERLNEKQYVSFFSRLNMQTEVRKGKILSAFLQNDLKYVLFKLNDLSFFLLNIKRYFPNVITENKVIQISAKSGGVLKKIEDDSSVKLLIDEQLALHGDVPVLTLISSCMNEFGEFYHKMTLKDWLKVVKSYIKNKEAKSVEVELNEPASYMVSEENDYNYGEQEKQFEEEQEVIDIDDSEIEIVYVDKPGSKVYDSQSVKGEEIIVREEVKKKEPIDKNKLKKIFDNTVTSYKYFWFMAIISLAKEKGTLLISFKDIMIRMAAIAWPMVLMDEIKLGDRDQMSKYLNEIHRTTSLTFNSPRSAVNNYLTQNYVSHRIESVLSPLLNNVPYRFLSPWIRFTNNEEVIEKSQEENSTALYSLHKSYIVLNNEWWDYINAHFLEIGENTLKSFISYARLFNPEMKLIKIKFDGWSQIINMQKK